MPYTEPTSLAIVACPGGEAFADEVITHLKHMYKHRFTLKNDVVSKRYELTKEELIQSLDSCLWQRNCVKPNGEFVVSLGC